MSQNFELEELFMSIFHYLCKIQYVMLQFGSLQLSVLLCYALSRLSSSSKPKTIVMFILESSGHFATQSKNGHNKKKTFV